MAATDTNAALAVAEKAIRFMRENETAISPAAFEIWFTHVSGANASLSREIEKLLNDERPFDSSTLDSLYNRHFAANDIANELLEKSDGVCAQVAGVVERIVASGEAYRTYTTSLSDALNDLDDVREASELKALVGALADATHLMARKNRRLEEQLAETSEELSTLRQDIGRIRDEAYTDGLTGVANRKQFDIALGKSLERRRTLGEQACLLLADVDHFKAFNDKWGHQAGDQVLKLVASSLRANTKGRDLVARYGGEEFAIILPKTSLKDAVTFAENLREQIAKRHLSRRATSEIIGNVTITFGVSELRHDDTAIDIVERADKCLYAGKHQGRNCVVSERDIPKL